MVKVLVNVSKNINECLEYDKEAYGITRKENVINNILTTHYKLNKQVKIGR